jgi:homoserine dehydrogenase
VVTANKTLVAYDGIRLSRLAAERGAAFLYEAAVGAAVPIVAALRQRQGDRVRTVRGILNGTCSFVLESMERGVPQRAAVAEAVRRGFAEPDPSADLSGRDTAEKLAVLALALGIDPPVPGEIATTGIESTTPEELRWARKRGCAVRLLGEIRFDDAGAISASVAPTLLPLRHPLAAITGAQNAVIVESDPGGELFLRGEGAGPGPTASALIGDALRAATEVPHHRAVSRGPPARAAPAPRAVCAEWHRTTPSAAELVERLEQLGIECTELEWSGTQVSIVTTPIESVESLRDTLLERGAARVWTAIL